MSTAILPATVFEVNPEVPCTCRDCGQLLDQQPQADGKGGSYIILTCWNPQCLLRTVTRSASSYLVISEGEWESYREMNRKFAFDVQAVSA